MAAVAEAESAETARIQAAVAQTKDTGGADTKATLAAATIPAANVDAGAAADCVAVNAEGVGVRAASELKATPRLSVGAQVRKGRWESTFYLCALTIKALETC